MDNTGGNCCCHVCDLHAASLDNQILSCYRGDKAAWPSCQGHPDICRAVQDNIESGSGVSDIEKFKVRQGPEKVPGPGVKFLAVETLPSSILVMCSPPPQPGGGGGSNRVHLGAAGAGRGLGAAGGGRRAGPGQTGDTQDGQNRSLSFSACNHMNSSSSS